MRLLLIEDDREVAEYICKAMRDSGYYIDNAYDGYQGLLLATTESYDVLIVDRMLPELDGITLIKMIREKGNMVPVLILSALGQVDDRVEGLRSGGDDYLTKPFAFSELLARVEVLQRHIQLRSSLETKLRAGDLEIDILSRKVIRNGQIIDLQAREYRLLAYIMKHKGKIVTRTMLLENVWDYNFDPQTNIIDVHISRLRNKIDKNSDNPLIRTVRGAGYIIDDTN